MLGSQHHLRENANAMPLCTASLFTVNESPLSLDGRGLERNQSDMAFDDGDGDNKASFGHSLKRSGGGENIVAKISLQRPRGGAAIGSTRDTPIMIPQSLRNEKADSGGGAVCQWRNSPRSPIARRTGRSVTVNGNLLTVQPSEGRDQEPRCNLGRWKFQYC